MLHPLRLDRGEDGQRPGEVSNQTANHAKLRRVELRNAPILTAKNAENTKNPTAYFR